MAEAQPKPDIGIIDPELNRALAQLGAAMTANPQKHEPEPAPPKAPVTDRASESYGLLS